MIEQPFVELFLPKEDWMKLKQRLNELAEIEEITYLAGSASGDFEASDEGSVNPVTWGAFKGKEYVSSAYLQTHSSSSCS